MQENIISDNHPYTVEPMQPADLDEATRMRMQSWRDTYVNNEIGVTAEWLEAEIQHELSDEGMQKRRERGVSGWVARDSHGTIIGVSMPYTQTDGTQRVGGLYVDKHWHGSGVSAALMQRAVEFHDAAKPIVLGVAVYNERAKAFYRKWGFRELPGRKELFREKIPTIRMVRPADSDSTGAAS